LPTYTLIHRFFIKAPLLALEWLLFWLLTIPLLYVPNSISNNLHKVLFFGALFILWIAVASKSSFYRHERSLSFTRLILRSLFFCILFLIFYVVVTFFFSSTWYFSEHFPLISGFLVSIFTIRILAFVSLRKIRSKSSKHQQKIAIYNSSVGKTLASFLKMWAFTGYKIVDVDTVLFNEDNKKQLIRFIQTNNIRTLFVPVEIILRKSKQHLFDLSWDKQVNIKIITSYDYPVKDKRTEYYGLLQAFPYRVTTLDIKWNLIVKRLFDILFSSLVILLLLSWFIPLMVILIKIDSNGPAFFIQKRPGIHGKIFKCFKFRSMKLNKVTEISASRNDHRVTKVGKFIRKTSIDELPQFINVFFGQMSIVGPRPNLITQNKVFSKKLTEYSKRMFVKPGITGLAQVSGARGGIEEDIEMKHRIKYDIFYIRNWSFALDIKIIIRTVFNIFRGEEKAY